MEKDKPLTHQLVNYFFELKDWDNRDKEFYQRNNISYGRFAKPAKELLVLCDYDLEEAKKCLDRVAELAEDRGFEYWGIDTAVKRWIYMSPKK